jgi:ParB/RepB/Spo0J family partition protein
MVTLELGQLDLRYSGLRIADPVRRARLEQVIAQQGQQVPVLVVASDSGGFVLIEGFGRVAALRRLGRDTVQAVVLDVGETDALLLCHRLDHDTPRSALEEGWLVATLVERGRSQAEVATALAKSTAWVSRRLALVRTLPEVVQEAVRVGRIGAGAAEKYLVPLSRGNAAQCARLVEGLRSIRPTVREVARLYTAWKAAPDAVRQQIVEQPLLYLKAEDAVRAADHEDVTVLRDVEAVAGVCGRARKGLRDGTFVRLREDRRSELASAWQEANLAFSALSRALAREGVRAGS